MSTALKNITIVGATGNVGKVLLPALLAAQTFTITVLRRTSSSPSSTIPSGVRIVEADFSSVASLTSALAGQDALVSTVGATALDGEQKNLIDAAVAAGVKRFLPSEYGCDLQNELAAQLPVFAAKVAVARYLEDKARTTPLTYTLVYSGPFFDWGLRNDFIFKSSGSKPVLYDGGNTVFSASTLDAVAQAVVGVLSKPDGTKNRAVRFQSVAISQKQLLDIAKEVAPERDWQLEVVKLDDVTKAADERLAKGLFGHETFAPYILRAINDERYGPKFETLDNELLGIKQLTEEEVKAIVKENLNN